VSRSTHVYIAAALVGGLLLTACSLLNSDRQALSKPHAAVAAPAALHISQVDFGHNARFTRCIEPACPSVTPKTLAPTSASVTLTAIVATPPAVAGAAVIPRPIGLVTTVLPAGPRTPAPHRLTLHFGTNSAVLTAAHKVLLSNAIGEFRRTDRIVIAGRTDDLGSEPLNEALALARALAIRDHLLDLAPDLPARIAIDAKGLCCYATPNDSNAGRARNRRVEVVYTPRDEGAP
jgi:outer membrane protein OmpA-like peptidoglycan-associated protein